MTQPILTLLQALCSESEVTKTFFAVIARRKNNAKETRVNRTTRLLELDGVAATKSQIVRIMQRLEELGLGRYIPGRHSSPSRFEWSTSALEVAKAATGQEAALDVNIPPGPELADDDGEVDSLEHRFHLRQDLEIAIELPADLSRHEAERLAAFIRTLPIIQEGGDN